MLNPRNLHEIEAVVLAPVDLVYTSTKLWSDGMLRGVSSPRVATLCRLTVIGWGAVESRGESADLPSDHCFLEACQRHSGDCHNGALHKKREQA